MKKYIREPINFLTHGIPALLAIPATFILINEANGAIQVASAITFGLAMITLFAISAIYHGFPKTEYGIRFWQKFDHCCIYLMIAGSYTPTTLIVFEGWLKWTMFGLVWTIALIGCLLKIFDRLKNTAISLTLYIGMGCIVLPLIHIMLEKLPIAALYWLLLGGAFYLVGTIFYKKDRAMFKYFHTHELWHIFVVLGAASHYVYNYKYLIIA
ncbi:PAQR family membrane homeostasis protein TrhA [Pedobacter cryophilus]|uniref:Hemolysin III family protein n=1 Tax=Pedobacter cryophilus TaxID=2571271 RepID=A0A4U1C6K9_9SPHI|nr:hemolysin III family protein [Pedobacter cryophilus]TKC00955.1 hemolysin III family protein [Pedobacter cryophilus]